jgi:hypothetical protein
VRTRRWPTEHGTNSLGVSDQSCLHWVTPGRNGITSSALGSRDRDASWGPQTADTSSRSKLGLRAVACAFLLVDYQAGLIGIAGVGAGAERRANRPGVGPQSLPGRHVWRFFQRQFADGLQHNAVKGRFVQLFKNRRFRRIQSSWLSTSTNVRFGSEADVTPHPRFGPLGAISRHHVAFPFGMSTELAIADLRQRRLGSRRCSRS